MTTNGTSLWVGGQFSVVNGVGQQGLTSFKPVGTGMAPNAEPVSAIAAAPPAPSSSISRRVNIWFLP